LVGGQPVSNLAVAVFPSSIDLAELLDQTRADLESRGMRLQPAQPVDLADGTPAQRFEGIVAHPQDPNVEVHSLQLLAVHDGAAYAVIASSGADAWPQKQAQLQESVESLRFTG
jgi:hypothetical protein